MKKVFCLAALATVTLMSCKSGFKKISGGIEYKIISAGNGAKLVEGNSVEISVHSEYKDASIDTVLSDSKDMGTQIFPFNSQIPQPFYKIFSELRDGDSLVLKQSTDSAISMGRALPFMKKGEFVITGIKVVNIYTDKDAADSAAKANYKIVSAKMYEKTLGQLKTELATTDAAQLKTDDAILNAYMTKNNIKAVKSELGAYVALTDPGTGDNLDKNSIAMVKYTGKTLNDTTFDSNIDPKFNHTEPLEVNLGQFRTIAGWVDGLKLMKKGSKGVLLIPSSLAYGKTGSGPKIKPNENLIFNIEIVDVITAEQAEAKKAAEQAAMMAQRQHYMDSVQKARAADTSKK